MGGDTMARFKLQEKADSSNKTIRMPDPLIQQLDKLAAKSNLSFSAVIVQCCEFALKEMEADEPASEENPQD